MMNDAWTEALRHLDEGNFTLLQTHLGGPEGFDRQIIEWHKEGRFDQAPELLAEALSSACMLGRTDTARYLLENGVDPYAGMKTWLAGPHWAASSAQLDTVKMLIEKGVPLEVENRYGGTVLGQALWSAINEHRPEHADIIEALIIAGSVVQPGTLEWWEEQNVPNQITRERVSNILKNHADFHRRVEAAKDAVSAAESSGPKRAIADSLKALGNILRRPPFTREAANEAYARAADLYRELGVPLEEAWVKRHIGINHEYAERLEDAEKMYDEALALYRHHANEDTLDYANTVRYPAVVKNRLGKRDEAAKLWEEAHDRYAKIGPGGLGEGVAEAAAWLTIFALDRDDLDLARKWFAQASKASAASGDPETHNFIAEVKERLEGRGKG